MTKPIHAELAAARALVARLVHRADDLLVARRPIDFDLDARIVEAELDVAHLERRLADGCVSRHDQPAFEPADLELRLAA